MLYELSFSPTINSHVYVIVRNPHFENGILRCTKIAEFRAFGENGACTYIRVTPRSFVVGGGLYTLEEFTGEIIDG